MASADDFKFPFAAYDVQVELMNGIYGALNEGQVGIFESPTGTGKSMSIICASLRWLKENPVYVPASSGGVGVEGDEELPAWVLAHAQKKEEQVRAAAIQAEKERLARARQKMEDDALKREQDRERAVKQHAKLARPTVSMVGTSDKGGGGAPQSKEDKSAGRDLDGLVLSDSEESRPKEKSADEMLKLLFGESEEADEDDRKEETEVDVRKIIYCSRTHSQLSQFMREVKRTHWGRELKAVALASRKSMCINDKVLKLKSAVRINAACLDLCRNGGKEEANDGSDVASARRLQHKQEGSRDKKSFGCPYRDESRMLDLRDAVLAKVQDIEDVVSWGSNTGTCPYYASRAAVKSAELVTIPYNSLVHKGTREALGVSLEGNVVIIDEAHNLIDSINGVHSAVLSQPTTKLLHTLFTEYLDKFVTRLSPKNAALIRQVIKVLKVMMAFFRASVGDSSKNEVREGGGATGGGVALGQVMSVAEFSIKAGLGTINLFDMVRYFEESKILQKLHGYYERRVQEYHDKAGLGSGEELGDSAVSVVQPLHSFLMCLTEAEDDGRVALSIDEKTGVASLSYQLLNASAHFQDVLDQSHAVVLAGGTMQPMSDYVQQLMPGLSLRRLRTLSVGHVIPDANILPLTLSTGPTGLKFDFRMGSRSSAAMMEELGRVVLNVCSIVPDGVVLFLPSYTYEEQLHNFWESKGYIEKIEKKKKVLREPRNTGDTDAVLDEYAANIKLNFAPKGDDAEEGKPRRTGSLLLSVVGGKLSEGINFSDGLGRCVIVAGLPFANAADPQLKEKIRYITSLPAAPALASDNGKPVAVGKLAGQEYYQNMCMKAVNQCIGRAIRHIADYAAIILIDHRYQTSGVRAKIAGWIRERLTDTSPTDFGPSYKQLAGFFASKRPLQLAVEEERRKSSGQGSSPNKG